MSPKLKALSGKEVISIFEGFGFRIHSQRGSHVKLRRQVGGHKQTLTIVSHNELDTGTLRAIIRHLSPCPNCARNSGANESNSIREKQGRETADGMK